MVKDFQEIGACLVKYMQYGLVVYWGQVLLFAISIKTTLKIQSPASHCEKQGCMAIRS